MANQTLAGYALCLHPDLAGLIPGLRPMFRELKALENPPKDFRVMGQICIASSFRRQGLFRGLYEHFKKNVAPLPVITEVARSNKRSLKAHSAIGFKTVAIHSEGGETWEVLCW